MTSADMIVELHRMTTIITIARIVIRPARAASVVAPIPVTSSPTTSGTITICNPCSQAAPIGWVTAVAASAWAGDQAAAAMPIPMPPNSAASIRVVCEMLALRVPPRYQRCQRAIPDGKH